MPKITTLPRKVKHTTGKQLGYPDEKWARGEGGAGYARSYGHNTSNHNRTRAELLNNAQRKHDGE